MWLVLIFPAFAGAILIPEGCKNTSLCGQLSWSKWSPCSRTCGGGSQTRKREICSLPEWSEEDVETHCGKPLRLEYRVCNPICLNGGVFADDSCICKTGKTGRCCENGVTSLEKLITSKEKASSFLRETSIRSKRDDHIDEECRESGTCDHEEVREWIHYSHDYRDVCQWMKDRRCDERRCEAGKRCITTNPDCSRYSHYKVGCTDIDECASNPCYHGGTCHNLRNRFTCSCPDDYYGTQCEHACTKPEHCLYQRCSTRDNYICTKCIDQGTDHNHSIYYVSPNGKKCEATCSWKQNWCWPGTCGENLAKNCVCRDGFSLSSRDSHKICNLNIAPDLETCRIGVQNHGGEARNSTSSGPCLQEKSNYMKFQPAYSSIEFTFGSTINVSAPVPERISEFQFGVVNSTILVSTRDVNGHQNNHVSLNPTKTSSCSRNNFTDTNPITTIITCKMTIATPWTIQDGEQFCMEFVAYGGGYLKTKDFNGNPSSPHIYRRTRSSYEVCMRRDSSAPKHCSEDNSCTNNERILFENRITKTADINISLKGWFDPYRNTPEEASGIKSYSITIHDMKEVDKSTLSMYESSLLTLNISTDADSIQLPDKQPALYGVSLDILDNAGNFKQARRFVLFDNSSKILINAGNKLKVYSGNPATNFTWQTNHGQICVHWVERYYNSFHVHHNLLRQIKADYHNLYSGVYEQYTGQLPVKGTPNVHGILGFRYVLALNSRVLDNKTVPNFTNQSICQKYNIRDGETYDVTIIPIDIMNNTIRETIPIHIDASVPDIVELYLIKDGVRQLFVHNSTDLSRMTISFKALDEHSGLDSIEWMLGTSLDGGELGNGSIAVNRLEPGETCNHTDCYCPKVGVCEKALYSVKFNSLIKNNKQKGHHNRGYFFTVKVTNNAKLVSISRTDILDDDSPPESGIAMEGEIGSHEMDYTSNRKVIVRWRGFIDHESGIKKYRVGFSEKCLSREELLHNNHTRLPEFIYETNNEHIRLLAPSPGQYFTSVIAYNYALEPSEVACSNGITYDISPPQLYNIILEQAKTTEVIACYNRSAWLIFQNFTAIKLDITRACRKICNDSSNEFPLLQNMFHLKQDHFQDTSYADSVCQKLDVYDNNVKIYIPSDTISVSWNVSDRQSQIHDIQIGFASTKSQSAAPDILSFTPSKRLQSDKRLHSALDSGIPFFITIKATNKAGLETSVTIGPVVIDDTPPLYRGSVNIVLDNVFAFVVWTNETFVDEEQNTPISTVLFKIGQGSTFKSPILQGYLSKSCPNFDDNHTCLKYPVRRIQQLNEDNTVFFFELYVYNIVGHATTVRTEEFSVPSPYPPTTGTVLEISNHFPGVEDLDYIASDDTICLVIFGFKHLEIVSFEVAFSSNFTDDLMTFRTLPSDKCFYNVSLPENTRIFTIIKAISSGGSTLSFSDGFFIIDKLKAAHSIVVYDGVSCFSVKPEFQTTAFLNSQWIEIPVNTKHLLTGKSFTLQISGTEPNLYTVSSKDVIWTGDSYVSENILKKSFVAMIEHPGFLIKTRTVLNTTILVKIINCYENTKFQTNSQAYLAYWSTASPFKHLVTHYRTGLLIQRRTTESYILPLQTTMGHERVKFRDVFLEDGLTYRAVIEPCFERLCIEPQKSNGSKMLYEMASASKVYSMLKKSNDGFYALKLHFDGYRCSDTSYSVGYAVAIIDRKGAEITKWESISIDTNLRNISAILKNISLPVYTQHSLSVCVKGFCLSGKSATSCQPIKEKETVDDMELNNVYEINANSPGIKEIKSFAHSRYLGDKMKVLHDNEVDFIKADWKINGVLLGTFNRKISWYIMTENRLPLRSCTDDVACVQETVSEDCIGYFKRMPFEKNKKYFLCAFANKTIVDYEKSFEQKDQIFVCGNGFIIDDTSPVPGKVQIQTDFERFLNFNNSLSFTWEGFSDIEGDLIIQYTSGIEKYNYSIGTYPGGEDVVSFTDTGLLTSATVFNISFRKHITYYATVRAIDRVGHITEVSSQGVMYDDTPPVHGRIFVDGSGLHGYITNHKDITVTWDGFSDPESGIKSFQIGIGSSNLSADIFPLTEVMDTFWKPKKTEGKFMDGYEYFILLKITNNAGLPTLVNSMPFIIDSSPPHEGFVIDGNETGIDIDFQRNVTHVCSRWDGFHDPHTKLAYYEIGIGTTREANDVFPGSFAGLVKEHCWANEFIPGEKYFTNIRACNQAGLCASKSSNGVTLDNSPPIAGLVHVGMSDRHQHYISHKNAVSAQWIGFQDPHSDIEHFEWCISKSVNTCDITAFENVLLTERITKTSINLPHNTNLYVIVRAYNRVGLYSQQTSEKFRVDTTPPIEVAKPVFDYSQFSHRFGTQYDDSVLVVEWKFTERESFIASNEVVLKSHKNGKTITDIKTNGNENNITIRFVDKNVLKSGDSYYVFISSCNAAGLCTHASSDPLLIDSSPPQLGGFKNQMNWKNDENKTTQLLLLWYGFSDIHSGIEKYGVFVSESYSGSELSDGIIYADHKDSDTQRISLILNRQLSETDEIILSVFALNKAGLRSKIAKTTVTLVADDISHASGFLKLQRYLCRSHTCNNDCTCSVIGFKCQDEFLKSSVCKRNNNHSDILSVSFGNKISSTNLTLSSRCVYAHWRVRNITMIQRFEWSIGIQHENPGAGVFDSKTESVWHENGHLTNMTYCIKSGKRFIHGESYVLYVRSWISKDTYFEKQSNPLLIDTTPPVVRRRKSIKETLLTCTENDIDFLNSTSNFLVCWEGVFIDNGSPITKFSISSGSSPFGNDLLDVHNVGLLTSFPVDGKLLEPGVTFYFTVTATNSLGMEISFTSDGVLLDLDNPLGGVVYNTRFHKNKEYQSSTSEVGLSWHGFDDHNSFIKNYQVILTGKDKNETFTNTIDAKIRNTYIFHGLSLQHNRIYEVALVAFDAVGHSVGPKYAQDVKIDTTSPTGFRCTQMKTIPMTKVNTTIAALPTKMHVRYQMSANMKAGEFYQLSVKANSSLSSRSVHVLLGRERIILNLFQNADGDVYAENKFISKYTDITNISVTLTSKNMPNMRFILHQCLLYEPTVEPFTLSQVLPNYVSVSIHIQDIESGIKSIYLGTGTTRMGYQVRPLLPFSTGFQEIVRTDVSHNSSLYFTVIVENNAGLKSTFHSKPLLIDHTKPDIDNIKTSVTYQEMSMSNENNTDEHNNITLRLTEKRTETTVKITWDIEDKESGIHRCECGVGLLPFSTSTVSLRESNTTRSCVFPHLDIRHGTQLFITIECTNNVGLRETKTHGPIIISFSYPENQATQLSFIPNNAILVKHAEPIITTQSSKSRITFLWNGFSDISGIREYKTRLWNGDKIISPWKTVGLKTYASYDIHGGDGDIYRAEVKAINHGGLESNAKNRSITADSRGPHLTGERLTVTKISAGKYTIDWSNVFEDTAKGSNAFIVSVGSNRGYSDLQSPTYTLEHNVSVNTDNASVLYINVRGICPTGESQIYHVVYATK